MRRNRWLMSMLAVTLVSGAALSGCGGDSSAAGGSKGTEGGRSGSDGKSKETYKIEIALDGSGLPSPQDNIIEKTLGEKLGVNVSMTAIQGGDDYLNQLKVRVAAGNYPDLMRVDLVTLNDFARPDSVPR